MSPDVLGPFARWIVDAVERAAERGAARALASHAALVDASEGGRWLSAAEVAEQLSMSAPTARALLRQAGIRPLKLGNVLRYSVTEIGRWLDCEQARQRAVRHEGRVEYLVGPTAVGKGAATASRRTAKARSYS